MLITNDPLGAFMHHPSVEVAPIPGGPLDGLTVAIKDLYDVAGYKTGCGQPLKLEEAVPARAHAPVVKQILDAGAVFLGKTITDELAFSLNGQNAHYGTPVNPAAPDRIPGGSSSGSASAVAGGLVDFALGTDTGGSVRAPASYCGLFGLRPTHGAISLEGCMPLAPSFDTAGWFTRDAPHFKRIGDVLLPAAGRPRPVEPSPVVLRDAFSLMFDGPRAALEALFTKAEAALGTFDETDISPAGLDEWLAVFRIAQGHEIWQVHGAWIEARKPEFGPGVKERFEWARSITDEQAADAAVARAGVRERVVEATANGQVLVLPTVPSIAPLKVSPIAEIEEFRNRALSILCISGLSGLPQMTVPLTQWEGAPLGLSLLGPEGSDRLLIDLAVKLAEAFSL